MINVSRALAFSSVVIFFSGQAVAGDILSQLPRVKFPKFAANSADTNTPGAVAEADIAGKGLFEQSVSLLLNVGEGYANDQVMIYDSNGDGIFDRFGCVIGSRSPWGQYTPVNNTLTAPFQSAHMRVEKIGDRTLITLTNIDHGQLEDQFYECLYGPYPEGTNIGIGTSPGGSIDNFGDGTAIRDSFGGSGPLSETGNWENLTTPGLFMENGVALSGAYPNISAVWVGAGAVKGTSDVGGALQGVAVDHALCVNQATGQRVLAKPTNDAWNCENAGLKVSPGTPIMQIGVGTAR